MVDEPVKTITDHGQKMNSTIIDHELTMTNHSQSVVALTTMTMVRILALTTIDSIRSSHLVTDGQSCYWQAMVDHSQPRSISNGQWWLSLSLENFRFTTSTTTSTRKCLSCWGLCRQILCMLNGCLVLAARKSLQSVTNQPDKLKL